MGLQKKQNKKKNLKISAKWHIYIQEIQTMISQLSLKYFHGWSWSVKTTVFPGKSHATFVINKIWSYDIKSFAGKTL